MSKRLLIIILIAVILLGLTFIKLSNQEKKILSSIAPSATPTPVRLPHGKIIDLNYNSQSLRILSVEIPATSSMTLIPNFSEKLFGENISVENDCDVAINGGFYKGDHTPLGLFVTNGNLIGKQVKSSVANGFFWQEKSGIRQTSSQTPVSLDGLDFILQAGPYFKVRDRRLNLINDAHARRSLIGEDSEGNFYFTSVLTKQNSYSGPFLADLPVIFSLPQLREELPLTTLLNLDGGGASFFYSRDDEGEFILSALSPIGSVLCVRM